MNGRDKNVSIYIFSLNKTVMTRNLLNCTCDNRTYTLVPSAWLMSNLPELWRQTDVNKSPLNSKITLITPKHWGTQQKQNSVKRLPGGDVINCLETNCINSTVFVANRKMGVFHSYVLGDCGCCEHEWDYVKYAVLLF